MTHDMYIKFMDKMAVLCKKLFGDSIDDYNTKREIKFKSFRLRQRNGLIEVLSKHGILAVLHPKRKIVSSYGYYNPTRCTIHEAPFVSSDVVWFTVLDNQNTFGLDFSISSFKHNEKTFEDLSGSEDVDDIEARKFQYSLFEEHSEEYGLACMMASNMYDVPFNEVAFKLHSHLGSTLGTYKLIFEELGISYELPVL